MLKSQRNFYITTSIAYVNSKPHIGFAMELVQADAVARYHRLRGDEVYFLTGTDEHGTKIVQTAKELGVSVRELVDGNAEQFRKLTDVLGLSNDDFIRTSSEKHHKGAQKMWKKLVEAGDIYKHEYQGLYCVGCEAFIVEKDLKDGVCPNHLKRPEVLKEENYFFRLSRYSDEIARLIEKDALRVIPESRKNEILRVAKDGLTDVSFSRPKKALPWGVEVPHDPSQVMYVWCDALSNYITALGYEENSELFQKFWPANVHLIGKDILRFHAGVWIGMLLSAKLPIPKSVYVHGFITSEGQKMSKSLGNVVDPFDVIEEYGLEAVRYYLLKEIPTTDDGDFSKERFKILYNTDLANNLGNLLNRVLTLALNNLGSEIEPKNDPSFDDWPEKVDSAWLEYQKVFDDFDLKKALEVVFSLVNSANVYVDQKKPWAMAKEGRTDELHAVLYALLEVLRHISIMLLPFMPETAKKIAMALCAVFEGSLGDNVDFGKRKFILNKGGILFERK